MIIVNIKKVIEEYTVENFKYNLFVDKKDYVLPDELIVYNMYREKVFGKNPVGNATYGQIINAVNYNKKKSKNMPKLQMELRPR